MTYLENLDKLNVKLTVTILINDWKYPLYLLKSQNIGVAHAATCQNDRIRIINAFLGRTNALAPHTKQL